jgi:hypothetical protein
MKKILIVFKILILFNILIFAQDISKSNFNFQEEYRKARQIRFFVSDKLREYEVDINNIENQLKNLELERQEILENIEIKKEVFFSKLEEDKKIKKELKVLLKNLIKVKRDIQNYENLKLKKKEKLKDFGNKQLAELKELKKLTSSSEIDDREKNEILTEYKRIEREINRVAFNQKYLNELFIEKLDKMRLNNRKIGFLEKSKMDTQNILEKLDVDTKDKAKEKMYEYEIKRINEELNIINSQIENIALKNKYMYDSIILKESEIYLTQLILSRIESEYNNSIRYLDEKK